MKVAIITGASSGMGREFALQMDAIFETIDEFWLIARRNEELESLSKALVHTCRIFSMDITKAGQAERLEYTLKLENAKVCFLVNCAGYGLIGPMMDAPLKDTLGMIRTNCEALTEFTYRTIPYMTKNARIIMLASSAAFLPQAGFAVYAATKSYVLSFSRALAHELHDKKIYITAVCPGPVDTPFFDIAERTGSTLALKKKVMASPDEVVAKALKDSFLRKEVSVYGAPMIAFRFLCKAVPHGYIMKFVDLIKK